MALKQFLKKIVIYSENSEVYFLVTEAKYCLKSSATIFKQLEGGASNLLIILNLHFEPMKIRTLSAPQNDRLNLSFVADILVAGEKMTRKGRKMAIY